MIVNIDYDDAMAALRADLLDADDVLRCQHPDCGSPRLQWYRSAADSGGADDIGILVVDCEDCPWRTHQRFNGINYQ